MSTTGGFVSVQRFRGAIGLLLVTTLVAAQFAGVVGATAGSASGDTGDLAAAQSDIDIVGVEMPEEMEPGTEYRVRVRIRNTGESAQNVEVAYSFEGRKLMYYDELVPAGETIEGELPLTVRDISQSRREPLTDGQYTHSMSAGDTSVSREVTISGVGTPTPTPTAIGDSDTSGSTETSDASGGEVTLLGLEFPDRIPVDGEADVQVRTSNPSDGLASAEVVLRVEGAEIVRDQVEFPAGEQTTPLPVGYEMISARLGDVGPGTYAWEMSVGGTTRSGTVEIVDSDGGANAGAESSGESDAESMEAAQPDEPARGFFTNGESGPAFLDSFSLTVGGFVLSAVGIFYQMLQGA